MVLRKLATDQTLLSVASMNSGNSLSTINIILMYKKQYIVYPR